MDERRNEGRKKIKVKRKRKKKICKEGNKRKERKKVTEENERKEKNTRKQEIKKQIKETNFSCDICEIGRHFFRFFFVPGEVNFRYEGSSGSLLKRLKIKVDIIIIKKKRTINDSEDVLKKKDGTKEIHFINKDKNTIDKRDTHIDMLYFLYQYANNYKNGDYHSSVEYSYRENVYK